MGFGDLVKKVGGRIKEGAQSEWAKEKGEMNKENTLTGLAQTANSVVKALQNRKAPTVVTKGRRAYGVKRSLM